MGSQRIDGGEVGFGVGARRWSTEWESLIYLPCSGPARAGELSREGRPHPFEVGSKVEEVRLGRFRVAYYIYVASAHQVGMTDIIYGT